MYLTVGCTSANGTGITTRQAASGSRKPPTISTASTSSPEAVPSASQRWSRAGCTAERSRTTSGARPATRPRRALRAPRTSPAGEMTAGCTRTATTEPITGAPSVARYRTTTPDRRSSCTRTASTPATARTSSHAARHADVVPTVVGYEATLEFDLDPMRLRIIHHRSEKVEQMRLDIEDHGHGGGDLILAKSFLDLVKGRARPDASLRDGLLSAAMCLAPVSQPGRRPSNQYSAL